MENQSGSRDKGATQRMSISTDVTQSFRWLFTRPLRTWSLFLTLLFICTFQPGGPNSSSRLFAMNNLIEEGSPRIDRYHALTIDWSRTPDGHYYSNKAPGPILLGLPFYYVLDKIFTRGLETRDERDVRRVHLIEFIDRVVSYFLQTLPLFLLTGMWLQALRKQGVRFTALQWMVIALLLGNTLTLMTSTYYGHAMTAVFLLAMGLGLWRGSVFGAYFFWGLAVLSEYSAAVVALPLTIAMWPQLKKTPAKNLMWIIAAGIFPGVLWTYYHLTCFGGLFALPNKFQNPAFVDTAKFSLWGIFGMPSPYAVIQLLFGWSRGLLFTQPWMLVFFATPFFAGRLPNLSPWQSREQQLKFVTITGFILLLVVNAAFGNWEAGAVAGPRYLSPMFGLMALLVGLGWKTNSPLQNKLFKITITISAIFQITWLSLCSFPNMKPLWAQALTLMHAQNYGVETFIGLVAVSSFLWILLSRLKVSRASQHRPERIEDNVQRKDARAPSFLTPDNNRPNPLASPNYLVPALEPAHTPE